MAAGRVLTLTGILVGLAMVALALAVAAFVVPGIECDGPVGLLLAALLYQGRGGRPFYVPPRQPAPPDLLNSARF